MSSEDDRLDERLRRSGESWRSSRDVSGWHIEPTLFHETRRAPAPARVLKTLVSVSVLVVIGVLVVVSLPRPKDQVGAVPTPTTPSSAMSPTASASPSPTPTASAAETAQAEATAACSALLDDLLTVMVVVQSGQATLAAAFEVTGDQLADYLEQVSAANDLGDSPSVWREQPTKVVVMCIIDGDLMTQTPGPPEADRSAVRVLAVISDGEARLWAIARKDKSAIPITDPATTT